MQGRESCFGIPSEERIARLGYYERDEFDAELRDIELPTGNYTKAWVFLSNPDLSLTSGKWRLGDWQRQFKRESLCQARSAMAEIDTLELDGLARKARTPTCGIPEYTRGL